MNCIDGACWHLQDRGELTPFNKRFYCTKNNCEVPDPFKEMDCSDYKEIQSCSTCKNSHMGVWESGTIDCLAYRCESMDMAISYLNNAPLLDNFSEQPTCPINSWEKDI